MDILKVLKAISDEKRLRIINLLSNGEFCVCKIENILNLNQSNTSKHLSKLKAVEIIKERKDAQWRYFSLNNETLKKYLFLNEMINKNLNEAIFMEDNIKIEEYKNSCK